VPLTNMQRAEERDRADAFIAQQFAAGALPPFSLRLDGRESSSFLADWRFAEEHRETASGTIEKVYTYSDDRSGMEIECRCEVFADFPAIEWVVTVANNGSEESPLIDDLQALDWTMLRGGDAEFVLHRALGSSGTRADFAPISQEMPPSARVDLAPIGGRSSNTTSLPFFNLEAPNEGVVLGIGWSGQWQAQFDRDTGTALRVRVGMERTRLQLKPGERIRTPRVLLLFWNDADRMRGQNMLRRYLLMHRTPQADGGPVTMPLAASGSGLYTVANEATVENQVAVASRLVDVIAPEYFWLDAGWFEGYWPNGVGNFKERSDGFPDGLSPLSQAVNEMGMDFILWFEPERVYRGTQVDREHPEWVLRIPGTPNGLLDLGNPEALKWVTDEISRRIDADGIKIYREDYNLNPLRYWRENDLPGREGMTEIRWMEGLYAFWDELAARHPDLIIDNCASGGRCLDLERVMRSIPLWRTDYAFFPGAPGPQCHTHGISLWLPCSATGSDTPTTYDFRSALGPGLVIGWRPQEENFPLEHARKLAAEFKKARPYFYGDYYPLTPHSITDDAWIGYQFHREDLKSGLFLAFRRPNALAESLDVSLGGLDPETRYEVCFEDTGENVVATGAELAAKLTLTLDERPGALLAFYRELQAS
jgi:alpha-galactosidase